MAPSGCPFHLRAATHTSVKPPAIGSVDAPSSNKGSEASHGRCRSVVAAAKVALRLSPPSRVRGRPLEDDVRNGRAPTVDIEEAKRCYFVCHYGTVKPATRVRFGPLLVKHYTAKATHEHHEGCARSDPISTCVRQSDSAAPITTTAILATSKGRGVEDKRRRGPTRLAVNTAR
eukprot:488913-Amphidinium_carterae.1